MIRRETTAICALALCAFLSACADESGDRTDATATPESHAAPEPAPSAETAATKAPANAKAVDEDDDDDAILAKATDPELCGDEPGDAGGLDLPMPDASDVTVTGYEPDPTIGTPSTLSNDGTYLAVLDGTPEIVVGKPFGFSVTFTNTNGDRMRINNTAVSPDAYMPQHFHGMNVTASAERTGQGTFDVHGMVFHMTGLWEVYLDFTVDDVTERAQFVFDVK